MSLIFAIEPLEKCWNEVMVMAQAHWAETEGYRNGQECKPSFERYNTYDKCGWFLMFTARKEDKMVGYAGMYITPSMHTQEVIASEDTWFLLPEYRKGRNAIRFYNYVEEECRRRGATEIGMTAKMTNHAGKILEYLGYKETARQFIKFLNPLNPVTRSADSVIPANQTEDKTDVRSRSAAPA